LPKIYLKLQAMLKEEEIITKTESTDPKVVPEVEIESTKETQTNLVKTISESEEFKKINADLQTLEKDVDTFALKLVSLMSNEDDIYTVLKIHLFAEHYLDELICLEMPSGYKILDFEFTFWQKLRILNSMNILEDETTESLTKLNKLRNNSAHTMGYDMSVQEIDKIGRPLGPVYSKLKKECINDKSKLLKSTLSKVLEELFKIYYLRINM